MVKILIFRTTSSSKNIKNFIKNIEITLFNMGRKNISLLHNQEKDLLEMLAPLFVSINF